MLYFTEKIMKKKNKSTSPVSIVTSRFFLPISLGFIVISCLFFSGCQHDSVVEPALSQNQILDRQEYQMVSLIPVGMLMKELP